MPQRQVVIVYLIAISLAVLLLAFSQWTARRLAQRKNRRPVPVILAGTALGIGAFGLLWTVSLVYGGLYARLAGIALFIAMPALVGWLLPAKQ